jgi:hypothetical protein
MLWLKGQLISLKTMSKKCPVTELLEFEPLSVWSWASLPYKVPCYKIKEKEPVLYVIFETWALCCYTLLVMISKLIRIFGIVIMITKLQ